jgi:hypothetical protein
MCLRLIACVLLFFAISRSETACSDLDCHTTVIRSWLDPIRHASVKPDSVVTVEYGRAAKVVYMTIAENRLCRLPAAIKDFPDAKAQPDFLSGLPWDYSQTCTVPIAVRAPGPLDKISVQRIPQGYLIRRLK